MGFQQTLRWVQATRAMNIVSTCIAVILFSFVMDMRYKARKSFVEAVAGSIPGIYENTTVRHSSFGTLALLGLATSLVWNGLCLFDLCILKHYRFDRRICIFTDMLVAVLLLVTGFLNFAYDAMLYFALEIAKKEQMKMEIGAMVFLAASCLLHLGFFCYGCKDPAAAAIEFEHVALEQGSPVMRHLVYSDARLVRGQDTGYDRPNTSHGYGDNLLEIDLGKKVHITNVRADALRSPRSPEKRSGFVGAPAVLAKPQPEPAQNEEEDDPFVTEAERRDTEWI